jgi:hypothetical protein
MKKIYLLILLIVQFHNLKSSDFFGDFFDGFKELHHDIKKMNNRMQKEFKKGETSIIKHSSTEFSFDASKEQLIIYLPQAIDESNIQSVINNDHIVIKINKDYFGLSLIISEKGYQVKGISEINKQNDDGYASSFSEMNQSQGTSYKIDLKKVEIELSEDKKIIYLFLPKNTTEKHSKNAVKIKQRDGSKSISKK